LVVPFFTSLFTIQQEGQVSSFDAIAFGFVPPVGVSTVCF